MKHSDIARQYKSFFFPYDLGYKNELTWDMEERKYPEYELEEGMYRSFSPEDMKRKIKEHLELEDWQISTGFNTVSIIVPDFPENLPILENLMKVGGYFFTRESDLKLLPKWKVCRFERWQQESHNIRSEETHLFHISRIERVEKIQKLGIIPHGNDIYDLLSLNKDGKPIYEEANKLFKYPHRVFFFRGTTPEDEIINYTSRIVGKGTTVGVFRLDLNKVTKDVQFYVDPSLKEWGVYTKENIRPEWLEYQGKFRV